MSNLSTLETVLTWEGAIDNARIREVLDVKAVWASRLMGELAQHLGARGRRASPHAPLVLQRPPSGRQSPDDYLRVISTTSGSRDGVVEDARLDLSPVPPQIFAAAFGAIKRTAALRVVYRSMSTPNGSERIIFPHHFVRAPRRWHLRAWCTQRRDFRDFTLGRIVSAEPLDEASAHLAGDDLQWNRIAELLVVAHPALSTDQQTMIAQEYFPGARALRLRVRECLASYAIQDLRLALNAETEMPPTFQLLVANAAKLRHLFVANA